LGELDGCGQAYIRAVVIVGNPKYFSFIHQWPSSCHINTDTSGLMEFEIQRERLRGEVLVQNQILMLALTRRCYQRFGLSSHFSVEHGRPKSFDWFPHEEKSD
jgi:hypothetical protein